MERHLGDIERQLGPCGGPWVTGAQFTLADVSWAVIFERLREADWLEKRPSHHTAMTAHQHPLVRSGTARIVAEKARNAAFRDALYASP